MRLHLLAFGKLKTPGLRDAADYYLKMIQPWVPLAETELKPLSVPDKSAATRKQIQEKEGAILLEKISKHGTGRVAYYLLDESGKARNTMEWAELARSWERDGLSEIALCVGSSLGFSETVRRGARGLLSLGPQTLPHELARVVILEQLYRAWSVIKNHPYHNEGA